MKWRVRYGEPVVFIHPDFVKARARFYKPRVKLLPGRYMRIDRRAIVCKARLKLVRPALSLP